MNHELRQSHPIGDKGLGEDVLEVMAAWPEFCAEARVIRELA